MEKDVYRLQQIIFINNQENSCYSLQYGCLSIKTEQVPDTSKEFIFIRNSQFIQNVGQIGVGLYIANSPFKLQDTLFLKNNGTNNGGAIFVTEKFVQFSFTKTFIIENSAYSGGGISLEGPNYLTENNFIQSILLFNSAIQSSNNLVEAPDHLKLQINNIDMNSIILDKNIYQLNLKKYKFIEQGKTKETSFLFVPSNQSIYNYKRFNEKSLVFKSYITSFSLIYKNSLEENLNGQVNDNCQLFTREISENLQEDFSNYTFNQNFSFFTQKTYFDLSSINVKFDPYYNLSRCCFYKRNKRIFFLNNYIFRKPFSLFTAKQSFIYKNMTKCKNKIFQLTNFQLLFTCSSTTSMKSLSYQINAKTFKCQLGEFYTNNGCQQCEPNFGFYSVEYDVVKCSIFDVNKLENITSNQLQLRIGYWRPNYHSNLIELCFKSLKKCSGGWKIGDDLCFQGHIGALCEECDSFNTRGDGNFVKISNTECGSCKYSTLFPFFLILLWSLISILVTLRSTNIIFDAQKEFQMAYSTNLIRKTNKTFVILKTTTQLFSILFQLTQDFQSILLKMLLNYIWLFSIIFAFNVDFNFSLLAVDSISSPNFQMTTNLDCYIISLGNIQLIYMRLAVMIILMLIQILIILLGFKVLFWLERNKFDYSVISNLLIYLFVSNQAQLIKSFGSLVAIRTISGIDYIQGDVSLLFYEKDHTLKMNQSNLIFQLYILDLCNCIAQFNCNRFNNSIIFVKNINVQQKKVCLNKFQKTFRLFIQ